MSLVNKWFERPISINRLILLVAIYFTLVLNAPFLSKFIDIVTKMDDFNPWFASSVPFLLLSVLVILFTLVSSRHLVKPVLIVLTVLSSLAFYATMTYGIVFDYGMIENMVETDTAEASTYLNYQLLLWFTVTGLLPAIVIAKFKLQPERWGQALWQRSKLFIGATVAMAGIAFLFYGDYASVSRNNHNLQRYMLPLQYISAGAKYLAKNQFKSDKPFMIIDSAPKLLAPADKRQVVVLVVGETARAHNFAYNGYERDTNPYTQGMGLSYFNQVYSCGTSTAVSVPCMFSVLTRENYDKSEAQGQQNMLDLMQSAGVDVLWIDNNSGCKEVCNRVKTIQTDPKSDNPLCDGEYCLDEALMAPLQDKLAALTKPVTFIVLHTIGSHGPTYYRRYDDAHRLFNPDCPQREINNCTSEQLINTYDNTIAYTDFILANIVERLKKLPNDVDASMLYVSDHGESLGESGIYLHGFPYAWAPKEQIHIPLLFWQSQASRQQSAPCVNAAEQKEISHDYIFHSMLGMTGVNSKVYDPKLDFLSGCHDKNRLAYQTSAEELEASSDKTQSSALSQ